MNARPQPFPFAAVSFKAWTVGETGIAYPADLPDHVETAEQAATLAGATHKQTVLVLHSNDALRPEQRHVLSVYQVKKSSKHGVYRAAYDGGRKVFEGNLEPILMTRFAVAEGFAPVRPFDAFRDNAVGRDLTLVEAGK